MPATSTTDHSIFVIHTNISHISDHLTQVLESQLPASCKHKARAINAPLRKKQFIAARSLLYKGYMQLFNTPALLTLSPSGRPSLNRGHCSISHSKQMISTAISLSPHPIGLDIEQMRQRNSYQLAQAYFDKEELAELDNLSDPDRTRRFYQQWTLKEASCKAFDKPLSSLLNKDPRKLLAQRQYQFQFREFESFISCCVSHPSAGKPIHLHAELDSGQLTTSSYQT